MRLRSLLLKQWKIMTYDQRFENLVAIVIKFLITLVIVVALLRLFISIVGGLVLGALDPLDHKVFQSIFGEILTVLIALEFNHTLQYEVKRQQSIIQMKVILLIALLAVARKFIILDIKETAAETMLGLAAITLALGIVYWLLRERDDRLLRHSESASVDEA